MPNLQNIKKIRKKLNWTQTQLAEKVKITQSMIGNCLCQFNRLLGIVNL